MKFGDLIKEIRLNHGKTMAEVASYIGVKSPYISNVEKNNDAPFTSEKCIKFIELFNLDDETAYNLINLAHNESLSDKNKQYMSLLEHYKKNMSFNKLFNELNTIPVQKIPVYSIDRLKTDPISEIYEFTGKQNMFGVLLNKDIDNNLKIMILLLLILI